MKLSKTNAMSTQHAAKNANTNVDDDIYADLVDTLFDTTGTLVTGICAGLLAPVIAWLSTGESTYLALTMLMLGIAAYRIHILVSHNRTPVAERRRDAKTWEFRYTVGAIGFMAAIGVSAALLFTYHHNEMISYYGVIIMTGVTGVLASRNAARPQIVAWQVMGTCMPLAITVLFNFSVWYWGLTLFLVFGAFSVISTTKFLHGHLESALRNGLDANIHRKRLGLALNSMSHGLCMGGANGEVTVVNHRVFEFFGIVAATTPIRLEAIASSIGKGSGMTEAETRGFAERWKHQATLERACVFSQQIGDRIFDFRCEPADAGGFVTVIEDVTEQRLALREIERIAHYDDLTGLPNRSHFQSRLKRDLRQIAKRGKKLALLSIDLDHFKEVNDALGHSIGDQLLVSVAARLRQCVQTTDMVARFGGDEFCVLLKPSDSLGRVEVIAQMILDSIRQPYVIDNHTILIGASIGLARAPRDAMTAEALFKCGDLALYRSKSAGRGAAVWFEPRMQEALLTKRRIETELRSALINDELVVYYQPIIDSRNERVTCLEALVRWRHPERGLVSPAEFIPVAEETGLIVELGEWVLRRACLDARSWPPHVRVAVNLSPRQFQQNDLATKVRATLQAAGLEADRLELEITETALLQETQDVTRKVGELDRLGVRLSLDDFGTGYSSLCHLDRFPVKKVKIDRSFTRQMIDSAKTRAIVEVVELLASKLDIELVAEGVETQAQLACLAARNIFLIQGFLYSQPRPIEELQGRLEQWSRPMTLESAA
jgi:diguanylate cyclase (GGDEF)-like protein